MIYILPPGLSYVYASCIVGHFLGQKKKKLSKAEYFSMFKIIKSMRAF